MLTNHGDCEKKLIYNNVYILYTVNSSHENKQNLYIGNTWDLTSPRKHLLSSSVNQRMKKVTDKSLHFIKLIRRQNITIIFFTISILLTLSNIHQ